MFNASLVRMLQWLRSPAAREVFADLVARLCVASIVGAAWLFYIGGPHARVAPGALLAVGAMFFIAGLIATPEG
ncbi:MAG: hypothetical protein ABIU96_07780 [Rhodanobacter sp.]